MVFPKPIFLRRTVLENLEYVLEVKGIYKTLQKEAALDALTQFSMSDFAHYPARSLSSGEKQRLSVIRALLIEPDILFLDEPTANLDPNATATLENIIKDTKITTIMATHDIMQAKRIAENIIFIEQGKIIESSKASVFFNGPSSPAAQKFIEGKI
jgi:tungstate transport system ATP-binding protein